MSLDTFKEAVKIVIETELPELVTPTRHMMRAVVLELKGVLCDIQVLDENSDPHPLLPPLPNVPIPNHIDLQIGQLLRIGFYYGNPSMPYIDEVILNG